jgi:lipopolysaccharide/colanic/teichoic acid biosynthesis glycosyltransferase
MSGRLIAVLGLILLSPTLMVTAVAVGLAGRRAPILRLPLTISGGRTARCLQFRTSFDGRRARSFGRFLLDTRLSLLPALVDIVRGDIRIGDLV